MDPNLAQIIENVQHSFQLAKRDMYSFGSRLSVLNHNLHTTITVQNSLLHDLQLLKQETLTLRTQLLDLKNRLRTKKTRKKLAASLIAKTIKPAKTTKSVRKKFVASKDAKKVHVLSCVFAKNIRPKRKLYFASKIKPLNHGYKACECVKKI